MSGYVHSLKNSELFMMASRSRHRNDNDVAVYRYGSPWRPPARDALKRITPQTANGRRTLSSSSPHFLGSVRRQSYLVSCLLN